MKKPISNEIVAEFEKNGLFRQLRSLVFFFCVCSGTLAFGAFDTTGWQWQGVLDAENLPAGFVVFKLTPEVLDKSSTNLSDLRLLDNSGNLTPFILQRETAGESDTVRWRPVQLINRTFQPEQFESVVLDFGEPIQKNRVKVLLSETNYRRRALLEGSSDSQTWAAVLENAWLFDITHPEGNYKIDTLDFLPNNFRYLRLTVYNMPDDPRRIEIREAQCALYKKTPEQLEEVPVDSLLRGQDDNRKESTFELDLRYRNLPLDTVRLSVADHYFYRGYELLGRDAKTHFVERMTEVGETTVEEEAPWALVRRGVFHRSRHEDKLTECLAAENLNARYRYLKLRIFNEDNPPLSVEEIHVFRRQLDRLVFEYNPSQTYTLITGNPKATPPRFDLARAVSGLDPKTVPTVTAGPLVPLPHEPQLPPWTEHHRYLIWLVLILAVIVMAALVLRSLRFLPKE